MADLLQRSTAVGDDTYVWSHSGLQVPGTTYFIDRRPQPAAYALCCQLLTTCTLLSGLHTCRPLGPHSGGAPRRGSRRHTGTQAAAAGGCPPLLHLLAALCSLPGCLRLPPCSMWGYSSDKTLDKTFVEQ